MYFSFMIEALVFSVVLLSCVLGGYAIILNHNLRVASNKPFVHSLFYFQVLGFLFGFYGILGSLLIRVILPNLEVSLTGIEVISNIIPFIGVPFLIAAWFMLFKVSAQLIGMKRYPNLSIVYFVFTLSAFLAYGLVIKNMPNLEFEMQQYAQRGIYLGYALFEFLIAAYVALLLMTKARKSKLTLKKVYLQRFSLILLGVSSMKSVALYFSETSIYIGMYFIIVFFTANLPLILLTRIYLEKNKKVYESDTSAIEQWSQYGITPREKEIILEICSGKTNQQIADKLFITLQTVKDHTSNIYRKVEVKNRVQLTQLFTNI